MDFITPSQFSGRIGKNGGSILKIPVDAGATIGVRITDGYMPTVRVKPGAGGSASFGYITAPDEDEASLTDAHFEDSGHGAITTTKQYGLKGPQLTVTHLVLSATTTAAEFTITLAKRG